MHGKVHFLAVIKPSSCTVVENGPNYFTHPENYVQEYTSRNVSKLNLKAYF